MKIKKRKLVYGNTLAYQQYMNTILKSSNKIKYPIPHRH